MERRKANRSREEIPRKAFQLVNNIVKRGARELGEPIPEGNAVRMCLRKCQERSAYRPFGRINKFADANMGR